VQQGEDISEAAEREVLEETGIRARFDAVLAMRQGEARGLAPGRAAVARSGRLNTCGAALRHGGTTT